MHIFSTFLIILLYIQFNVTKSKVQTTTKVSIELLELPEPGRRLSKVLKATNSRVRLFSPYLAPDLYLCLFWPGFAKSSDARVRNSYALELKNCDSITQNSKFGHFQFDLLMNETTLLYESFFYSQIGKMDFGCIGSSIDEKLSNKGNGYRNDQRIDPENLKDYIYMKYCPGRYSNDYLSTTWSLRPAKYTEIKKIYNIHDISSGPVIEKVLATTFLYRFENVVNIFGEEIHFCLSKDDDALKLAECGPITPTIEQWFEIIPE